MGFFDNMFNSVKQYNDAYQKNLQEIQASQPAPEQETTRGVLAKINLVSKTDPNAANEYMGYLRNDMSNPSSPFYNPYISVTNQAVANLASYGIDTSNIDDNWFSANSWLKDHYQYTANTNSVKSPGKRASKEEKAAYQFNQIWMAEEQTKKAETEWKALQQELTYWAQQADRNLSDDQIIANIDWSKYKTLVKMDDTRKQGTPMELNRAVGYSQDAMYGTLWAARNGGGTGDSWQDMINSYNGTGNVWKPDAALAAKLDKGNIDTYSPYSVGSTVDKERLYFGASSFDQKWLDENRAKYLGSNDETAQKMYASVAEAEQNTQQAEKELEALNKWVDSKIASNMDEATILSRLDTLLASSDYSTLSKMDKSIQTGGDLMKTTRAIDYRKADIIQKIKEGVANRGKSADETIETITNPVKTKDEIQEEAEELLKQSQPEESVGTTVEAPEPKKSQADLRAAYDAKNGAGAWDRDMAAADAPREKTSTELTEEAKSAAVARAVDVLHSHMSAAEQKYFKALPGVQGPRVAEALTIAANMANREGPINENAKDPVWVANLALKQAKAADAKYEGIAFASMETRSTFENTQKEADELRNKVRADEEQYGEKLLAVSEIPPTITIQVGQDTDLTVAYSLNDKGQYQIDEDMEIADNPGVQYYCASHNLSFEEFIGNCNAQAERLNGYADSIRAAKEKYPSISEEEIAAMPSREQLDAEAGRLANMDRYLAEHQDEYNKAVDELNKASKHRALINDLSLRVGGQYVDPQAVNSVLSFVEQFTNYEVPKDNYDSVITDIDEEFKLGGTTMQQISEYADGLDETIKDVRYILDNVAVPEYYQQKLESYAGWLEQRSLLYKSYLITEDENLDQLTAEGCVKFYADLGVSGVGGLNVIGSFVKNADAAGISQMTDTEQKIYFALYAQDPDKAGAYMRALSGSIYTRAQTNLEEGMKETADSGMLGRAFCEAFSIAIAPLDVLSSVAYMADTAINGKGNQWFRFTSEAGQNAQKAVISAVHDAYGDGIKGQAISTIYEILNNRGRSAMVAATFGGLFPADTSEIIQAFPIATTAAAEKLQRCIEAGLEPWQAWTQAAISFLSESVTEGIDLKHMQAAFEAGDAVGFEAFKQWVLSKFPDALSEMTGETASDLIDQLADRLGGEKSEYADAIRAYMGAGYSEAEAKTRAMADNFSDILHTALVSFLSPGADVIFYAGGKLSSYLNYSKQVQQLRRNGDATTTVRDLRNGDLQKVRAIEEVQESLENRELRGFYADEQTPAGPNPAKVDAETQEMQQGDYDKAITLLENAQESDQTTKTATVAVALKVAANNADRSAAAAVELADMYGEDTLDTLELLLNGGAAAGTNLDTLKFGIQYAALANGRCRTIIESEAFRNADNATQARWLSEAAQDDARNVDVQAQVEQAVHEFRVSAVEQDLLAQGQGAQAEAAQAKADAATMTVKKAEDRLEDQQDVEAAAVDNALKANANLRQNPTPENFNAVVHASDKRAKAAEVTEEYEQSAENAREGQKQAQDEAEKVGKETQASIRQQAEAIVAEQDRQAAEQAEQARLDEDIRREAMAAQRETNNVTRMDADEFIRRAYPNATAEEQAQIRETFTKVRDEIGSKSDALLERGKFARALSKKFGVKIVATDTTQGGKVARQNGYVNKNTGEITLDVTATMDDMMYAVLVHELTHIAEKSNTYDELADALIGMEYGSDTKRLQSDIMVRQMLYNNRLALMHEQDNSIDATPLTPEEAKQEIVADIMGKVLSGDQELIDRFAAEEPSLARRILESIKNFLKKMVGIEGAPLTQAENVVNMLETALNDAKNNRVQGTEVRHSLVTDADGNELATELPGGTVAVDAQYSLSSFTEEEQNRVREALLNRVDEKGKRVFTKKQVDQYMEDALGVASLIAADRTRLDFEASDNQVFLKPNNDYYFTLDASTLCAKRLLYQGTFDYVQHALPDEVFTPADLIDLANIMNEMGYETPCGICYVESRRRWLDTYAKEFLDNLPTEADTFIDKYFEKATDEEKAAIRDRFTGENPSIDDLTTSDGLEALRHSNPDMYKAFVAAMNKKGTANPKVVQLRTEYRGDIVKKMSAKDIQKVKDIGGLRIQSFSDFETPHLLDMMQAVYDMASVGLTSQAYTKVPNFAWVFGDTGIKINLSLIGKGTGLDENGNLVFDNREGIDFDEAMKLRDRYNKNVGTILVGINDEHIIAAMGDSRIDFIIPFHKSGWSQEELRKMPTLNNYNDYTNSQNELMIVGDRKHRVKEIKNKGLKAVDNWIVKEGNDHPGYQVIDQGDGKYTITYDIGYETESLKSYNDRTGEKLANFEPVGANQYWDFRKSGEWNARKYLKMCADSGRIPKFSQFLVDNGDGSFSLPEGTDKRSTAIREGYWKTLIDFKMYENDGYGRTMEDGTKTKVKGSAQTEVTPNVNMAEAYRVMNEYQLGRQMPDKENGQKGAFLQMKSNNDTPVAVDAGDRYIELIKEKRRGNKPINPNDDLHATPSIDVGSLGESYFHQGPGDEANMNAKTAFGATEAPAVLGNTESTENPNEGYAMRQTAMAVDPATGETVRMQFSLPVTDPETLNFLDEQEKNGDVIRTYRTMKVLDGKLTSPKATLINGSVEAFSELGQWEEATEHPELIKFDKNGNPKFTLDEGKEEGKKKNKTISAAYNPYMHSSNLMLNDQFSVAYKYSGKDPNLGKFVTVECIVPKSEATSGYQAQYAKDPVGWTDWKAGGVAKEIENAGGEKRNVFLSRWIKPVRIVPDNEVAQHYKQLLEGKNISVPANVVPPSLLEELEKAGVKIGPPQNQYADQYREAMGTKYSLPSSLDDEIDRAIDEMTAAEWMELMGISDESEEEAREIITAAVKDIKDEFDPTIYNGKLYVKPETLDYWLSGSGYASSSPNYSQAYIATMNPADFLRMTTTRPENQQRILDEAVPLNDNLQENAERQPIQLHIDHSTGKIEGHEGRHRCVALARAGVTEIPVVLIDYSNKNSKKPIASLTLKGQNPAFDGTVENGNTMELSDVLPLSNAYRDELYQKYTASEAEETAAAENNQRILRYSLPSDAPYLSAVDHGDMETAQKMVDEKAQENGYIKAGYHGTLSGGFTIFDKAKAGIGGNSGAGFYFSSNSDDANANYSDVEGADNWFKANHLADQILDEFRNSDEEEFEYEGYEITEGMPYDEVVDIAKKILTKNPEIYNVYLNPGKAYIRDFNNSTNLIEDVINNFDESVYSPDDYDSEDDYYDALSMARSDEIWQAISDAVYKGIADVDSNYEIYSNVNYEDIIGKLAEIAIDYETLTWNDLIKVLGDQYIEIGTEDMTESADGSHEIARAIVEAFGFDSIEDREVSKKFNQLKNMGNAGDTTHYIMFRPDQIKLADPVTYYDDGVTPIPLSERFKQTNNDIRYSLPSDYLLNQQIRQYIENGGGLTEQETLPGQPLPEEGGSRQRQFGRQTAQTSDALHQEVKDYLYTHSAYTPDTNRAQIDRAMDWVQGKATANDPDGYNAAVNEVSSDTFDYRSADGQARMLTVMGMAVLKGDLSTELRLADAYNKQGTDLGRQLQARKIFRMMTPIGRQATIQKMADQINEQYAKDGKDTRIGLSEWTLMAAAEAQTEEEFDRVRHAAAQELAEQMPPNWKDRLRGWRMLAMLGNPRTHIRNYIGNAMFVPAVGLKNKLGAIGEMAFTKGERTKTLAPILSKEARAFARDDALQMKGILTGEAKYNEDNAVQREQKPFKGLLQAVIDFNGNMLEKEDWKFLRGHYIRALGSWMMANKYTAEELTNNPRLLESGRSYAVQEAQKATYRDFSQLAATLNQVSRKGGVAGFLVDATLPFKKTPANILKRGMEYSVGGLMRSVTTDLYHLKQYNDYMDKRANGDKNAVLPEKAISPNQFIDRLCSGLTGTAIMAVGAILGHSGLVTCGLDDDDDKNEKEKGNQEYSFKFSIGGRDYTFTIDWAAPMSMPFFVGAAIQEQLANQKGFDIQQLIDAFGNITEPVFNLSMLDGVNTLFKTSQYDDTNTITQIGAKIASNYATSYVPSLMGAIARTVDEKQRKAFVKQGEGTGVLGTLRYAREQVENKIPGLSQTNIPVRDVFGNEKTSALAERILENFILPGYVNEYSNDPILVEMDRLYNANVTDSEDMVPKDPAKSITYKKKKYVLSAEEWDQYKAVRGQTAYGMLTELVNSEAYKDADEAAQVQMMKKCWEYADKAGQQAVIPDYELDKEDVSSIVKSGKIASYNADLMQSLENGDQETYDTMVEALHEQGVEDGDIKTKIATKYRDQYKEAYRKGNNERMAEIENILNMTGYAFDLEKWERAVDEK